MVQAADDKAFAELLVEWSLLSRQEIDRALKLHEAASRETPPPTFGDTLVRNGFLTARQLEQAQGAAGASSPASDTVPVDALVALHNPASKFGKYVLLGEVGRGGASVIKKAWDTEDKAYVALKFLRTQGAEVDPARAEELIREGWRAVSLRHPNIIRVYELGCIKRQYYLAMEYLEGFTLAELIRNALGRSKVSPFYEDPARYLTMLRDVARAVHYAHARTPPLIHCDLKPANVFIELSWRPYVLDFGVAHELDPADTGEEAGTLKGSPAYMAPEQVLAQPEALDARTDVYGLGAILYDLLTGRPPFTGELQEVLDKNLLVAPPKPTDVLRLRSEISGGAVREYRVPPEVEAICVKCLAKEKNDRYQTARDVADALTKALRARPVTTIGRGETVHRPPDEKAPASPQTGKRKVPRPKVKPFLIWALMAAMLLGGVCIFFLWDWREALTPQERLQVEMDAHARVFEVEKARRGYGEFGESHPDAASQNWVSERIDDLNAIEEMRSALAAHLSKMPAKLDRLELVDLVYNDVKIVRADNNEIEVLVAETYVSIDWNKIKPSQVAMLAQIVPAMSPRARLGLASYEIKNGLWNEAMATLRMLTGAPELQSKVAALEKEMGSRRNP